MNVIEDLMKNPLPKKMNEKRHPVVGHMGESDIRRHILYH